MKFKYSTYSCNQNIQEINRSVNKEAGLKKSTHTHTTAIGNFKAEQDTPKIDIVLNECLMQYKN